MRRPDNPILQERVTGLSDVWTKAIEFARDSIARSYARVASYSVFLIVFGILKLPFQLYPFKLTPHDPLFKLF